MFQRYVGTHIATQDVAKHIASTGLNTTGNLTCLGVQEGGKAVAALDVTYLFNINLTGLATASGWYIAQAVKGVQGYPELVSLATCGANLTGMPVQACLMGFHTYLDLSTGPNLPIMDPSITWFPIPVASQSTYGSPTVLTALSFEHAFPVENDPTNALYFGIAAFGIFGTTALPVVGCASIRQVTTERATFMPSK